MFHVLSIVVVAAMAIVSASGMTSGRGLAALLEKPPSSCAVQTTASGSDPPLMLEPRSRRTFARAGTRGVGWRSPLRFVLKQGKAAQGFVNGKFLFINARRPNSVCHHAPCFFPDSWPFVVHSNERECSREYSPAMRSKASSPLAIVSSSPRTRCFA